MKKQMISFTDPQAGFLKAEAERLGISVSELVRRIIDAYIEALGIAEENRWREELRATVNAEMKKLDELTARLSIKP